MDFIILDNKQKERYSNDILKMLTDADMDFVPPLSARNSTLQSNFNTTFAPTNANAVEEYFLKMMSQSVLGIFIDGEIVGVISYIENHVLGVITEDSLPNIYISTLVLKPKTRGQKLTEKAYNYLFNELYEYRNIFTRTWSTNFAHLHILEKFNFREFKRIYNDRGNGVDTVYLVRERVNNAI